MQEGQHENTYQEEWEYVHFATPQIIEKELHTLEGLLKGIAIDNVINEYEVTTLLAWCDKHQPVSNKNPFNELIPTIKEAIEDRVIDLEEKDDIIWLCQKYTTKNQYYDSLTSDMQRLHGVLAGIAADGTITEVELIGLRGWLVAHEHLRTIWPFDEIDSLITAIMEDGIIDEQEHHVLLNFCSQFLTGSGTMIQDLPIEEELLRTGVCSAMPVLNFRQKSFCLTGKFENGPKKFIAKNIEGLGGSISNGVRKDIDTTLLWGAKALSVGHSPVTVERWKRQ